MAQGRRKPGVGALLERERELEAIEDGLRGAIAGEGRMVMIEGPAGIGKTALLQAAARRGRENGMSVLVGRGGELEGHFPYGVVRQLFEPLLRSHPEPALLTGAARLAAPLVLGESQALATEEDRPETVFAHLHGLYWLTVHLAQRSPALMVVDDAHWADRPSLRFLLHLARRLEGLAAAILVASRLGERGVGHELIARLAAESEARTLRPSALSEQAVAELLAAGLGQAPDDAFVAACHAATGGVPFLVHELLVAVADDTLEPTREQAAHVQRLGPGTVARATLGRLGRMSASCVALARAVAVLAGDAQLPRASRLAGLSESDALEALDALVEAGVVNTGARLEFVHPIVRAAIYDELAPGERSRLHRDGARLLAAEGADLDAIAAQLLVCEPTGSQEVITQLREAAVLALERGAPEDAATYLSRALQEGCEREQRAELTFELATATRLAGHPSMVDHYREAHRLAKDPTVRNTAALELAAALTILGEWDAPRALVEGALAELGDRAPELSVRLERLRAGNAVFDPRLVGEFDRRLPILRDLVARAGHPAGSLALLLASVTAWRGGDQGEVVALVERGWDEGRVLNASAEDWTVGQGVGALIIYDELGRAWELVTALLAHAQKHGSLPGYILGSMFGGWIEARRGRLVTAEAEFRAALEPIREQRLIWGLPSLLKFAADVIVERPEAADLGAVAQSVDLGPGAETLNTALLLEIRGRVRYAAGEIAAGIADLRHAGGIVQALGFRNPNASGWRSTLALMLGADASAEAHRLAREELEDALQIGQSRAIGVALCALGVLEQGARGRRRLEESVSVLEHSPARLEYARALVELGAALRRARERTTAREPLRASLDLAVAAGATRLSERAQDELAASGARARRLRTSGRDALTPSELRVARLAADGRTNNEIAQALFVTPKTVDTHLSHVYAKLDISSRRLLAAKLGGDTQ